MSKSSSKPPNIFTPDGLRDATLDSQSSRALANPISKARLRSAVLPTVVAQTSTGLTGRPDHQPSRLLQSTSRDSPALVEINPEDMSDSDTEMASARSSFGDDAEEDAEDNPDKDILKHVENLFRLLDLIDEHGSGGIVEKIVIDQESLHRLLNTVQPGSYDSVSKINFKSLDQLSIKATGLYGERSEIIKYLRQARYLDDEAVMLLSGQIASTNSSASGLRSGLYLVLGPGAESATNRAKQAYIVYWPEESTWDDRAASSSVRRNRVTFMRYLSKLTEQIVALVSPDQANKLVWDAGARNKDLPAEQADEDSDDSRLFSFEVSKSLEQEEDAVSHPGFLVPVESKHLPKNAGMENVRFVPGEQKAGLLVSIDEPSRMEHKPFRNELINQMSLEKTIKSSTVPIQLGDLGHDDMMHLGKRGLKEKHPEPFIKFERCMREDKANRSKMEAADNGKVNRIVDRDTPKVQEEVQNIIRSLYDQVYPSLGVAMEMSHSAETSATLHRRYSKLDRVSDEIKQKHHLDRVTDKEFQNLKSKWLLLREYLTADPVPSEEDQADFVNDVLHGTHEALGSKPPDKSAGSIGFSGVFWSLFSPSSSQSAKSKPTGAGQPLSDPSFVALLDPLRGSFPVLGEITQKIYDRLQATLSILEGKILSELVSKIVSGERTHQLEAASHARATNSRQQQDEAFHTLMQELKDAMTTTAPHVIWVDSIQNVSHGHAWGNTSQYRWSGTHVVACGPQTRHLVYPLELTEQDSQMCQANEAHVPKPKLEIRHKFEFTLSTKRNIEFVQLVRDKCLVIISEKGKSHIYIEDNLGLDQSINKKPGKVTLNHDSLGGPRCLFAFDQATRLLVFVHGGKEPKISAYIFDELFSGLRSRGSPISLKGWYDVNVSINKICFVPGTEEVCLVESSGRARIFSLISQAFRPASLQISSRVIDAVSAPDGSCLLVAVAGHGSREKLLAFHWASFGKNQNGIPVTEIPPSDTARVVTRLEGRGRNHILSLSAATRSASSVAVQVKQKLTEFSFRSNQDDNQMVAAETFNNSLIDCHYEVWTRFPVVPAVSRCTLSPVDRQPRKLVFQSSSPLDELGDYFARMISSFERTTRKPMDGTLAAISVFSSSNGEASLSNNVSEFLLGSFIVELLCLIPLHLAITRDNRFIPLKDGVWDPAYERTLLGADVPAIIDALSLGWYESLFQSYMATKLVRVVSSMGEQSVGKSYCLNHFADTSFAGSAMRTTEGVWLSCTPTESYLLVSLDFEGVHSIERSAQEDALLVLFNTAISNMVLFRNNFALSRDIAGLFTSFQSSAMVLDPHANKGLFNSTLAIIIKDVTNSDAKDIVKEFSLKFRQIVEKEQDQNFISRLHRGHIQIIPWPVINSSAFYTLFRQLRTKLDQQRFTHGTAGAFLHNLKTLMAKIKAQDWGALDQNLAAHRAQQLLERLPRALCDGCAEDGPLKNMDTDEELSPASENLNFFTSEFTGGTDPEIDVSIEAALQALINFCGPSAGPRRRIPDGEHVSELQDLIYSALEQRINQVRSWVTVNVARFPPTNQDVRNLFTKINSSALAMRTAVRICSATCSNCQLHCLRPYRHTDESHDCGTDHHCLYECTVAEEHTTREPCGLPAGHSGMHMCDVKAHSCGSDCHLSKKGGCARSCVKPPFHEGEHLCSARSHLCGKRCDLQNAGQRGAYSCPGTCNKSWDEPHSQHACDNARTCPIECMLCRRLCCNTDHFHGLDSAAVHLCGQEHNCVSLCEEDGICQIETRPSAIQEQFSGRHEAFQYTRYSQVDRRLSCVIPIPPGELTHTGSHIHSADDDVFHFCDTRCPNCEYLCTLPLGHPQQLHETSHGSMTATRWVVEGDDANPVYELQGRKFGSGDEGAPMLCSLVCAAQGRHAHIDYCRDPDDCDEPECEHIDERMNPEPDRPKDWISHGFKGKEAITELALVTHDASAGYLDPYSQEEQDEFSKCDVLCAGPEHEATVTTAANPSHCTLPIFHAPEVQQPASVHGHVSRDGHSFNCQNPARLHQSYHIVFVIDSSGSMTSSDRVPIPNTPISPRLTGSCNNRYGAVLSALYGFWLSRDSAVASSGTNARQDAYSVVTFDHDVNTRYANDFTSTTDQLINQLIPQLGCGGTDFHLALGRAQSLIESHWSSDHAPVIVFLSDGECNISDNTVYDLCRTCVRLGKALAFYSVSFGSHAYSASLRQMADIAHEVYASAPQDALSAARGNPCAYTNAIDSIQLADTFLGIASSLQKPRASLIGTSGGRRAAY